MKKEAHINKLTPLTVFDNTHTYTNAAAQGSVMTSAEATAFIVQDLLSQGLSLDDIIMPGSAKSANIYMSDDFDDPIDDFRDYT